MKASRTIDSAPNYISVTQVSSLLNRTLEQEVGEIYFQGEISELKIAASGHIYYSIKDEKSQVSAVMWKGLTIGLNFTPKAGLHVLCRGTPTVYNVTGRLQIVVNFMTIAGEGLLQKKFLELKDKLEKEGLFAQERKRALPQLPRAVGIVTSASGAVIHDIMVKVAERMPNQKTFLIDVRVQGEGASAEIEKAIRYYNQHKLVDVIIVARGGGSLEDLWAFNEERTVRAIFGSAIPVVCGVGHEVDVTLSDLAADLRAPTPTAAAEFVVPKRADLIAIIAEYERRISDFSRWLQPLVQRVDELHFKMQSGMKLFMQGVKMRLQNMQLKVRSLRPDIYLSTMNSRLESATAKMLSGFSKIIERDRQKISLLEIRNANAVKSILLADKNKIINLSEKLESLSPLKVLSRGYSITEFKGKVLKRSSEVKSGDELNVILHAGRLTTKVQNIQ